MDNEKDLLRYPVEQLEFDSAEEAADAAFAMERTCIWIQKKNKKWMIIPVEVTIKEIKPSEDELERLILRKDESNENRKN